MGLETTQEVRFPVPTRHPHAKFLLFYSSLWFKRNGAHQDRKSDENGGEGKAVGAW